MHREVVDRRRWISEQRFLNALNYCMIPPGPEAQQLATYIGWLMHGVRGGAVAGALFVLPGFGRDDGAVGGVRRLWAGRLGRRAVVRAAGRGGGHRAPSGHPGRFPDPAFPALVGLAIGAFVALFFFAVPFPVVIGWQRSSDGVLVASAGCPRPHRRRITPSTPGRTCYLTTRPLPRSASRRRCGPRDLPRLVAASGRCSGGDVGDGQHLHPGSTAVQ